MPPVINSAPAQNIVVLATSDTVDFAEQPRGIIIGGGTVAFVNENGTVTSLASGLLAAGVIHPLSPKRINATGTTATILGVY